MITCDLFHEQAGVYFDEITGGESGATRYVPRSVQVDLEAGVCNKVRGDGFIRECFPRLILYCRKLRSGVLGSLFRPDTYLTSNSGAGNNWAKGCEYLVLSQGYRRLTLFNVDYTEGIDTFFHPHLRGSLN